MGGYFGIPSYVLGESRHWLAVPALSSVYSRAPQGIPCQLCLLGTILKFCCCSSPRLDAWEPVGSSVVLHMPVFQSHFF